MARARNIEKSAIDLAEEAFHLLRAAPAGVLARYYAGTVPFVLALLYFWADMSRSAFAAARCAGFSLALAFLFVWMKCWQAGFTRALWRSLGGQAAPLLGAGNAAARGSLRRLAHLAVTQSLLHALGLAIFWPSLVIGFFFPWVYAWSQNVTVYGLDEENGPGEVARRAWRQAKLRPGQNIQFFCLLALFGLFVALNFASAILMGPWLLKTLVGITSRFAQSPWAMLNSTMLAAVLALTYLMLDPYAKAAYVIRCFEGESLASGESLRAELARLRRLGVAAAFALALAFGGGRALAGGEADGAIIPIAPAELELHIRETIAQPRYAWRMPRERQAELAQDKPSDSAIGRVGEWIKGIFRRVGRWFDSFFDWLARMMRDRDEESASSGSGIDFPGLMQILLYILLGLLVAAVGVFVYKYWALFKPEKKETATVAEPVVPDLADEQVLADQLPTDEWLALARRLLGEGEARLAMRALFLACLAALAQRELVRVRKSKSNRDYTRELARRDHGGPELLERFAHSVSIFERGWYGLHEVTPEQVEGLIAHYEKIRALAG